MRIQNRDDLQRFIDADWRALGSPVGVAHWFLNEPLRIQRMLRVAEYRRNCGNRLLAQLALFRYLRFSRRFGVQIPPNVFGPGLSIAHIGPIIVNEAARVGSNCRIHPMVVIGTAAGKSSAAPQIGDNVYIGPGVKIFGAIRIGNNVAIGANAVVNNDVPNGVTVGGIPARVISEKGAEELIIRGA